MLTPGEILRKRRQTLKKTLSQVSLETKIQEKYLKLLESEEYTEFDSNVFISGFIKIYSEYLGLDVDKMLALYRRSDKALKDTPTKTSRKVVKRIDIKKIITPVSTVVVIILVSIILFAINIANKYNEIQRKPTIEIEFPENNYETDQENITLKGTTEKENSVEVNSDKITTNSDGEFEYEIQLKMGENIIEITAINTETDVVTVKTIRVERVEKKEEKKEEEVVEGVTTKTYNSYIVIESEAAWIQLNIDEQQKIANVVQPGKSEVYEVKESLQLVTGKPSITKLYINDSLVNLNINTTSGTASILCTIEKEELNCR
jgi:cytoskeletal protein RodZ